MFHSKLIRPVTISFVIVVILNLFLLSVYALPITLHGTLDTSDPRSPHAAFTVYNQCQFTVTATGTYSILGATSTPNTVDFWVTVNETPGQVVPFTMVWRKRGANSDGTLEVGKTYYMYPHIPASEAPVDYDVIIDGPGEAIFSGCRATGNTPTSTTDEATTNSPANIVFPPDNRINWQYGDGSAVVFNTDDGVVVYCNNLAGTWLGIFVDETDVANAMPNDGFMESVQVAEHNQDGCHTAFFILDSGEYQINIWTWDGKLYEIISNSLDFNGATMRYVDPSE